MSFPDLRLNKTYNAKLKLAVNKYTTIKLLIACLEEGRKKKKGKKKAQESFIPHIHTYLNHICVFYIATLCYKILHCPYGQ